MKGTVDKLLGLMKLGDDEYDEYEEDYEEVEEEEEKKSGPFSFFKKEEPEEEETEDEDPVIRETPQKRQIKRNINSKVVSMNSRGVEVNVIKPRDFSESKLVADLLRDGKTVVINMEEIVNPEAQRTIDFIGGSCYAVDGTLQAISRNIFIAAPNNIEVNGDLRDEIMNESIVSPKI
ncbi:MAG: cell division protein SepF [Lachnospiraceae bacterium]|nr:cell division protein SepF [Lachnospiraceae bacterium]